MHLLRKPSAGTALLLSQKRSARRGSKVAARAETLDAVRGLLTTLRGAAGSVPSLHGKVAVVTGASRGAFLLPAIDHINSTPTAGFQRRANSVTASIPSSSLACRPR